MKLLSLLLAAALAASSTTAATPDRAAELVGLLPEQPAGLGPPASDRTAWTAIARRLSVGEVAAAALRAAAEPVPPLPDDLFLEYSRDGNRTTYQLANKRRLDRLNLFAWAEALEHRGRFVLALERELDAILAEKTWVLPAHDPKLQNFSGREVGLDLGAAMRGWTVATVLWWHADQLAASTVARGRAELRRRIVEPYEARMHGGPSPEAMWWYLTDNNWNAVCHAGVLGVALATVDSRTERAAILAQAEANLQSYLGGFGPDGYCSEGIGYWNYGFGHFVMLAETVARATGGSVRLLAGAQAARIAAYPRYLEILPGVFPAFADMNVRERPSPWFLALAERHLSPSPVSVAQPALGPTELSEQLLYETALKVFLGQETAGLPPAVVPAEEADHHWFADAQVYVGRAAPGFGAAWKGGHNAEHHNHNDLGSFVVAAGRTAVLVDPGLEVYTARTFGPNRYASQVLSSYGHDVPVVAGQLQHEGRQFAARVLTTSFTPASDTVVLDLAGGYTVPALKSLTRSFTLNRGNNPSLAVVDTVEFTVPSDFATALVTFESWRETALGVYAVGSGAEGVCATVTVEGAAWTLRPEILHEDLPGKRLPTRLGIVLRAPVRRATIRVTITPQ